MARTSIPNHLTGAASYKEEKFGFASLWLDSPPARFTDSFPLSDALKLTGVKMGSVVGLDSDGNLVMATYNADEDMAIKPIGVAAYNAAAGTTVKLFGITRAGHLNGNRAIWDDSWTAADDEATEARKKRAFEGAQAPTSMLVGFNPHDTA